MNPVCTRRSRAAWFWGALCTGALAADEGIKQPSFPADNGVLKGDHAQFRTTVDGFKALPLSADSKVLCAPAGAKAAITGESTDDLLVRFLSLPATTDLLLIDNERAALAQCGEDQRVRLGTQYVLPREVLMRHDFVRTGVSFGGLVVPFKYRVGRDKELVSSATVAPYVGFRTGWMQSFGLTFTPVLAAGLSLVPVPDAASSSTTTKPAYTLALGIKLSSSKNDAFTAGLLYGRDFLNKSDVAADPKLHKPWLSFYVGASI